MAQVCVSCQEVPRQGAGDRECCLQGARHEQSGKSDLYQPLWGTQHHGPSEEGGRGWKTALGMNLHIPTDSTGHCGRALSVTSRTEDTEGGGQVKNKR